MGSLINRLVRGWTWWYTSAVPADARERRRAEIESDLWESRHDSHAVHKASGRTLIRLVCGVPADLAWRSEQLRACPRQTGVFEPGGISARRLLVGALGLTLSAVWAILLMYEQPNISETLGTATATQWGLRFLGVWKTSYLALIALLLVPVLGASLSVMLGLNRGFRLLRLSALLCLVAIGAFAVVDLAIMPWLVLTRFRHSLPFGPPLGEFREGWTVCATHAAIAAALLLALPRRPPGPVASFTGVE